MTATPSLANRSGKLIGLALTTALASATLTGCAASSAPPASLSANKATAALAEGNHGQAIEHAEAAVQADGRNASYRATLGAAYLEAGRFSSAATEFDNAMKLGDTNPRTALSLALALAADAKYQQAGAVLDANHGTIAASDLGLAYSLAGQPDQGIEVLSNAIRGGDNTPKVRQNLAYSYALAGRWREARLMASEDVPADKVGDRMAEWAQYAQPGADRQRVAALLSVPADLADPGEPVQLALANYPTAEQLASNDLAPAPAAPVAPTALAAPDPMPAPVASGELPPVGDPVDASVAPAPAAPQVQAPNTFQTAFQSPDEAAARTAPPSVSADFVAKPVVERTTTRTAAATARPVFSGNAPSGVSGSHLIQLGSFSSEAGARRAWAIYTKRYPELAKHDMVITRAVVQGKNYWRVSAGGYGLASAQAMCGRVKARSSEDCFAYAASHPLPGAVDEGTRFAMR